MASHRISFSVSADAKLENSIRKKVAEGILSGLSAIKEFAKRLIIFEDVNNNLTSLDGSIKNLIASIGMNDRMIGAFMNVQSAFKSAFVENMRNIYNKSDLTYEHILSSMKGMKGAPLTTFDLSEGKIKPAVGLTGNVIKAGVKAGALVAVTSVLSVLTKIMTFVENMKIIKTILSAMSNVFQVFFIPMALVVLGFLLPFLVLMANLLRSIDWKSYVSMMKKLSVEVMQFIKPLFAFLKKYLPDIIKVTTYVGMLVGALIIAPLLVIIASIDVLLAVISAIRKFIEVAGAFLKEHLIWLADLVRSFEVKAIEFFASTIQFFMELPYIIFSKFLSGIDYLVFKLPSVLSGLFQTLSQNIVQGISSVISGGFSSIGKDIGNFFAGSFQTGGVVGKTGIARVHAGETIIPAGYNSSASKSGMIINLSINVSGSHIDENVLADRIIRELEDNVASRRRWR